MTSCRRPVLVVLLVLALAFLAGCAPTASRPATAPFALGDTLQFYAVGASISDGNRQTIKVVTRPERPRGENVFYAIGEAGEKTTFLYYYPETNIMGVFVFLKTGREALTGDAVICFAEEGERGWTGGWMQATLSKFRQLSEKDELQPEGVCTVEKR